MTGQRETVGAHGGHQVDVEAGLPAGVVVAVTEPGGVVDHDVDATQRGGGCFDPGFDLRRIGQVAGVHVYVGAIGLQRFPRTLQALVAARAQAQSCAVPGEGGGDRQADAAAAAGNQYTGLAQVGKGHRRAPLQGKADIVAAMARHYSQALACCPWSGWRMRTTQKR